VIDDELMNEWVEWWSDIDRDKLQYLEINLSHCYFYIRNPTWAGQEINLYLHSERP
jgi:hypothetical protein